MKGFISLLLVVAVCLGGWQFWKYRTGLRSKSSSAPPQTEERAPEQQLPGLEPKLEGPLRTAQQGGAKALKEWLEGQSVIVRVELKVGINQVILSTAGMTDEAALELAERMTKKIDDIRDTDQD